MAPPGPAEAGWSGWRRVTTTGGGDGGDIWNLWQPWLGCKAHLGTPFAEPLRELQRPNFIRKKLSNSVLADSSQTLYITLEDTAPPLREA